MDHDQLNHDLMDHDLMDHDQMNNDQMNDDQAIESAARFPGAFNRRKLLQYGAGFLGVAALASCSSDSKSTTASTSPASTTTTGPTATSPTTDAPSTTIASTDATVSTVSVSSVADTTTTVAEATTTTLPALPADPTAILKFGAMRGSSYDPIVVGTQTEYPQLNVLFDTLVTMDPLTGKILPRIATAWTVMDDRIRFTIRDGVTFQDGTPLDATAVKFSIDRGLTDPASNIKTRAKMLASVAVVDPKTVDLIMSAPQPVPLLLQLALAF